MPKRRTTRATTSKRAGPVIPEGDEGKDLDAENRREKVRILIKDFETEMAVKEKNLKMILQQAQRQVDAEYSIGCTVMSKQLQQLKFSDVLAKLAGGSEVEVKTVDEKELAAIPEVPMETAPMTTRRTTRKPKQTKTVTTAKKGSTKPSSQLLVTPGNAGLASSLKTPIITPKFDPRLFCTPALASQAGTIPVSVARVAKPGELTVSVDGSPVLTANQLAATDDRMMVLPMSGDIELEGLDGDSIQGMFSAVSKVFERLKAVVNYPTK